MARPDNLPAERTSFVGRADELLLIDKLLRQSSLVTLTGAGGCGKTRLALRSGAAMRDSYVDGVWFVALGAATSPADVPASVAAALDLKGSANADLVGLVVTFLARRCALVILDNCEHVVDAVADLVDMLLSRGASLTVLATSRQPLGVTGEVTLRVPSLGLPGDDASDDVATIAESEAVRLFADRAYQARPDFEITPANAPAVLDVCRRLDGMPLGIELAAAQVRVMSAERIADGLSDRLRRLSASVRGEVPRHKTLWASMDWSHSQLTLDEQVLFRRLAVFVGSFSLAAVEDVCAGEGLDASAVLDVLTGLVDKSLVQTDADDRFRLLQTVRAYAEDALGTAAETDRMRHRHLDFFAALAGREEGPQWTSGLAQALARLAPDLANLRAALDWSRSSGRVDTGVRMLAALGNFFYVLGLRTEAWRRCEEFLATDLDPDRRGEMLYWGANFVWYSDPSVTLRLGGALVELGHERNDDRMLARGLGRTGSVLMIVEPATAVGVLDDAIAAARRAGLESAAVEALFHKTCAYLTLDQPGRALACGQEAIAAGEGIDWLWATTFARALTATAAVSAGELGRALAEADAVAQLGYELSDPLFIEIAELVRGQAGLYRTDPDAGEALARAGAAAERCGDLINLAVIHSVQGQVANFEGRSGDARRMLELAAAEAEPFNPSLAAEHRSALVELTLRSGDVAGAEAQLSAISLNGPSVLRARAQMARARGDALTAFGLVADALGRALEDGTRLVAIDLLDLAAVIAHDLGRLADSARILGAGKAEHERCTYRPARHVREELVALSRSLEAQLGDGACRNAQSQGASLSLADAVAYVRRGRGRRSLAASGVASLTPTERRVVELAVNGLSNAEIGERLFVSTTTVKSHLTHVFAKLGVANRRGLRTAAAQMGMVAAAQP